MKRHDAKMAELKRAFDEGKKRAWLDAIYVSICFNPEKPVPKWAKDALHQAIFDVMRVKATSWDDVLGKPHKGRKITQIRQQRALQRDLFNRVCFLRDMMKPKPRDPLQIAADEFNISRATAKRWFENVRKNSQTPKEMMAAAKEIVDWFNKSPR